MARYTKRIEKAEQKGREEFKSYLGGKYEKIYYPKSQVESYDLLCLTNTGDYHIFELKYTDRYYLNSFTDAMIDIVKWNKLTLLATENPWVFYMRMYKDGFAVWHINSLQDNEWCIGNYERKRITVSNSNNMQTKSKCVLIDFTSAINVYRRPNNNNIGYITAEEFKQLNQNNLL
jgi:hypothetical protein